MMFKVLPVVSMIVATATLITGGWVLTMSLFPCTYPDLPLRSDLFSCFQTNFSKSYYKILQTSCAIGSIGAFGQVLTSFHLALAGPQNASSRLRSWELGHFVILLTLFTSATVPFTIDPYKGHPIGASQLVQWTKENAFLFLRQISTDPMSSLDINVDSFTVFFCVLTFNLTVTVVLLISSVLSVCCEAFKKLRAKKKGNFSVK